MFYLGAFFAYSQLKCYLCDVITNWCSSHQYCLILIIFQFMEENKITTTKTSDLTKENIIINNSQSIKKIIYIVRGQKVMLDTDLASLYGYTTKAFNQQVKNNIEKFDDDFRFQLTRNEYLNILRSKNLTLELKQGKYSKYLPYVFTEQGVYMLMTVLKGELAIMQSKCLIRTFKEMKDYIAENNALVGNKEILQIYHQTIKNAEDIESIKSSMLTKDQLSSIICNFTNTLAQSEYLILNGQTVNALLAYQGIFSLAKDKIYIIDNYIGIKTLVNLKEIKPNISITIFSDNINRGLHLSEYQDFIRQYPNLNITFIKTNGKFHDRYIILDYDSSLEAIYHCGASSKDAGNKVTSISKLESIGVYHPLIDELLLNPQLLLK